MAHVIDLAWQAEQVNRVVPIATAAAIGLVLGRFTGALFALFLVAVGFLVAVVFRVVAQEREQSTSGMAKLAFAVAIGALAGRLMAWFGIIGGAAALVLLIVGLVAAGGDLM